MLTYLKYVLCLFMHYKLLKFSAVCKKIAGWRNLHRKYVFDEFDETKREIYFLYRFWVPIIFITSFLCKIRIQKLRFIERV
jgi:hypothetical protein